MGEKLMKQAILMGKGGPWEIKEVPIPKPGPNQMLIKMEASSICNQTDLNTIRAFHPPHIHQANLMFPHDLRTWDKRIPDELSDVYPKKRYPYQPFPALMGHEGMGRVVEVGPFIKKEESMHVPSIDFEPGDRVALVSTIGGFGEYVISEINDAVKVPDNVSDEEASLFEPVWIMHDFVRKIVRCSDTVCILGQGALGLLATQIAKLCGASKIIISEPFEFKRKLAKKFGADFTIDPSTTNVVHEIEKLTEGRWVNVVIEAAGEPETIRIIPYIVELGGKVGQIGACCVPVMVDWAYIHFKGLQVTGSIYYQTHSNLNKSLKGGMDIIASGKLYLKSMITHYYKLEEINKAFRDVESGKVIKGMFLFK